MSYLEDQGRQGRKIYREHTAGVDQERKAVKFGCLVTDQDADSLYQTTNWGDEVGWLFWEKNTRETGAWAPVFTVVMTATGILPVLDSTLVADTSFAVKTVVVVPCSGDNTKARAIDGEIPVSGDFGLVMQASSDLDYELIFVPLKAGGPGIVYVEDLGNGTGKEITPNGIGGWTDVPTSIKTMKPHDPLNKFLGTISYPFKLGRRYFASVEDSAYKVWLPGQGDVEKILWENLYGCFELKLEIDGQGNVVTFTGEDLRDPTFKLFGYTTETSASFCYQSIDDDKLVAYYDVGGSETKAGYLMRTHYPSPPYRLFSDDVDTTWEMRVWDNYDQISEYFYTRYLTHDKIVYRGYNAAEGYQIIEVNTAATGVTNKEDYFPDVDLYASWPGSPDPKYMQIVEYAPLTGTVATGNVFPCLQFQPYLKWLMSLYNMWLYYDPATDTASNTYFAEGNAYYAIDCGVDDISGPLNTGCLVGINDSASNYIFASGWNYYTVPLPNPFSDISASVVLATTAVTFVASRNLLGGRVYFPKPKAPYETSWWTYKDYTWQVGVLVDPYTVRYTGFLCDRWKSNRKGFHNPGTYGTYGSYDWFSDM